MSFSIGWLMNIEGFETCAEKQQLNDGRCYTSPQPPILPKAHYWLISNGWEHHGKLIQYGLITIPDVVYHHHLPSGSLLHNYGKSPSLMRKSTINGYFQSWLVVSTPLKNVSSSIGMMTFRIYGKVIHSCSSHHQPE